MAPSGSVAPKSLAGAPALARGLPAELRDVRVAQALLVEQRREGALVEVGDLTRSGAWLFDSWFTIKLGLATSSPKLLETTY